MSSKKIISEIVDTTTLMQHGATKDTLSWYIRRRYYYGKGIYVDGKDDRKQSYFKKQNIKWLERYYKWYTKSIVQEIYFNS